MEKRRGATRQHPQSDRYILVAWACMDMHGHTTGPSFTIVEMKSVVELRNPLHGHAWIH
jgi:hypothetical protein